ncbi:serine protease [Bradyrhizobium symbiodeficiens]|uniref:S1 family peptidase n=1 Tax=Bradyrhizobium symbiodeficiens TaxID=1404367 RepID=UPI0030D1946F
MDAYSRAVAQIELFGLQNGGLVPCGLATGFFYRHNGNVYLITNWHVVTGIDPGTLQPVAQGPQPEVLTFSYKQTVDSNGQPVPARSTNVVGSFQGRIDLYEADSAIWYEHSNRQYVDVVAFKVQQSELGEWWNVPVNEVDQSLKLRFAPGMDCFVLGYPKGMIGPGKTPIWKRGSIASEPDYDWRYMPAFLIDTATRDGMSGSPVVARHSGILLTGEDGGLADDSVIGTMTKFAGIYSGRIGEDEMGVQLGLVWKPAVLDDILSENTRGMNPLRNV